MPWEDLLHRVHCLLTLPDLAMTAAFANPTVLHSVGPHDPASRVAAARTLELWLQ